MSSHRRRHVSSQPSRGRAANCARVPSVRAFCSAKVVGWFSTIVRVGQTGFIYHYAFVMIIGVLAALMYFLPFWHA